MSCFSIGTIVDGAPISSRLDASFVYGRSYGFTEIDDFFIPVPDTTAGMSV